MQSEWLLAGDSVWKQRTVSVGLTANSPGVSVHERRNQYHTAGKWALSGCSAW